MIAPVLFSTLLGAAEIKKDNIFHDQGHSITHGKGGFRVNGQSVSPVDLSGDLQRVSNKTDLKKIFATGKALRVSRIGNDYGLSTQSRVKGGGPILGSWVYWATKTLCYGALAGTAAAGAAVVAPLVLPASAAGAISTGVIVGATSGMAGGAAATVSGCAVAGGVAMSSTAVAATAVATAELATATAATGGIVVAIESFSLFMGSIAGLAPTA